MKRLVHNLRKDEKKEEEIPEKKRKPGKKLPYLFIEADEDHVPLKEKGKKRKEEEEVQNPCQTGLRP